MAEMEMRAGEDVEIGCDVTPAIFPISFSLHDSFLRSHCSACFSPLSDRPFFPRRHGELSSSSSIFYCSPLCSSTDSPLHFSSAESDLLKSFPPSSSSESSADLRAALRLLRSSSALAAGERMFGLLTNREKLLAQSDEISDRVTSGATAMAAARRRSGGATAAEEEESALCLVITNGVEVVDEKGRGIGIAVYDSTFSWINHSCSPNACYRFLLPSAGESPELSPSSSDSPLRILSSGPKVGNAGGGGYGPRIVVRSIRRIWKGEEVTVAYTDLLQPKAARNSELWSKYRFVCCCKRCSSSSPSSSYVDHVLEEISASQSLDKDEATGKRLTDYVDEVITDFLSDDDGDPEPCCRKLEHLLISGLSGLNLHPFHHLALNAYTTLSSAYRIHASNLSSDHHRPEAFSKTRISAAYALFLAAAANHLFAFEPSLIACVTNYWACAGECLLTIATSSTSSSSSMSSEQYRCSKCSFAGALETVSYADFENVKLEYLNCIGGYARRSWGFLSKGCDYLERFEDPMDFSWVQQKWPSCSTTWGAKSGFVVAESMDDIWQLGAHCLAYGGYLAAVCYGEQSPWSSQIQRLLCHER